MIGALLLYACCYAIMLKGVPFWLHSILWIITVICGAVALMVWEQTKDRLEALEKKLREEGGE